MPDSRKPNGKVLAESPVTDLFENGRHPSESEKQWAEKTLAPTLEKGPEKPIGAPTGVNLDEHGHARYTTISGLPIRRLYTARRSSCRLEVRRLPELSRPAALHARHSRFRLSRQDVDHAPVLRLRFAGGDQRALQVSAGPRRRRAFRRLRSAHADGLRQRSSLQRRRGRQVRRGHRFARRHGDPLQRH